MDGKIKDWKGWVIDPPTGWKYGFPKKVMETCTNLETWLLENGYPQFEIDAGMANYLRMWNDEEN